MKISHELVHELIVYAGKLTIILIIPLIIALAEGNVWFYFVSLGFLLMYSLLDVLRDIRQALEYGNILHDKNHTRWSKLKIPK